MKDNDHVPLPVSKIPRNPATWYFVCFGKTLDRLKGKPLRLSCAGLELVAFRQPDGRAAVLDARCCHFGSDLGNGRLVDGCVECPLHGWRFDGSGQCVHIPTGDEIPCWAAQRRFPVAERFGQIFFFRGKEPLFPFPFFPGLSEEDLLAAPPFELEEECPWYMIAANGFDLQHYKMAHDRILIGTPRTSCPDRFARRIEMELEVNSRSVIDRAIRRIAGPRLSFAVTAWAGNLILVESKFPAMETFGFVAVHPLSPGSCILYDTVFIRRSSKAMRRAIVDRVALKVRRELVRRFLFADKGRMTGVRFAQSRAIGADTEMMEYIEWLQRLSEPFASVNGVQQYPLEKAEAAELS